MSKKPPNRGQRTKGVKLKHILQIGLSLGVCFWLIYQVKHSHEKRKEHDHRVTEMSIKEQSSDLIRLGRKDLHPRMEKNKNDKLEEEEDDKEVIISQEEDNEHLTEVQKEEKIKHVLHQEEDDEESKNEYSEDEGRGGGGDDEIDEHDQENSEGEIDRDEEFIDEEKEREEEEIDNEADEREKEGEDEIENAGIENKVTDADSKSTHEAREVHYKADDASSEVAHDTQTEINDLGKSSLNNSDGDRVRTILTQNSTSNSVVVGLKQNESNLNVEEGASGRNNSLSVKDVDIHKVNLPSPPNSSITDLTIKSHFSDQPDTRNRMEQVNVENTSNSPHITRVSFSEHNQTKILLGVHPTEKAVTDEAPKLITVQPELNSNSSQNNSSFTIFTENNNAKATTVDTLHSSVKATLSEHIMGSNSTSKMEDSSRSTADDDDKELRKMPRDEVNSVRTDERTVSSFVNATEHDSDSTSDSSLPEEEKGIPKNLGTMR